MDGVAAANTLPDTKPAKQEGMRASFQQDAYFRSMLLRAKLLLCKLPIQTDGFSYTAAISEDYESDDDDNEPVVEPLRQSHAQVRHTQKPAPWR